MVLQFIAVPYYECKRFSNAITNESSPAWGRIRTERWGVEVGPREGGGTLRSCAHSCSVKARWLPACLEAPLPPRLSWIPAFAGMTARGLRTYAVRTIIPACAGMTESTPESSFPRRRESIRHLPNTIVHSRAQRRISLPDSGGRFPDRGRLRGMHGKRQVSGRWKWTAAVPGQRLRCSQPLRSQCPCITSEWSARRKPCSFAILICRRSMVVSTNSVTLPQSMHTMWS